MGWQFYDKNGATKQAVAVTDQELAYIDRITGLTTTQTASASADVFLTAPAVVCDGSTKLRAEIFIPEILNSVTTNYGNVFLFEDGVIKTVLGREFSPSTTQGNSLKAEYEFTPAAGVHTYSARISVSGGTGTFNAGAAAGATFPPASLRISRANWAVYVPTRPPVFTTSPISGGPPANPQDGDIWIATGIGSSTRWAFQYNAASASVYKWEFIGGGWLSNINGGVYTPSSTAWTDMGANGAAVTTPRAGDWTCFYQSRMSQSGVPNTIYVGVRVPPYTDPGSLQTASSTPASTADDLVGMGGPDTHVYLAGVPSGTLMRMWAYVSATGPSFTNTQIRIQPQRIS